MPDQVKIAIIEDDIAIVQMYRMKFESEGFSVKTAGDGQSGLSLIEDFQPDIVLLDLMMPIMDGIEMLRKLRKTDYGQDIKVVVLTNVGADEAAKEVEGLGVEDYIVKADKTPREVSDQLKDILGVEGEE